MSTQPLMTRAVRLLLTVCGMFLLFQFISIYLSWPKQLIVGVISITVVILLNRLSRSQLVTIALMLLSLAATMRYGWWRIRTIAQFFTDESNDRLTINAVLMLLLVSAEAYTTIIMVLGYMQTCAPLRRKPYPLPADVSLWPHVDVLIPTYNELLSLVRYTALAAINIDYPPEKLHVYILDDGSREDFRAFAEEAGIGYITRTEHNHAKAGNINHALTLMKSPLVAIFDCDHVPTRSFLQVTVGWFLADKKLAMLQTPHFFYSPDPFERNLLQYKTIPNEGELFYGVIQDGNDLWNATFFCGSCAVIRRTALDEVGGIAVETVTEDAHTSLRMQNRGWNTAYINLPQAAGLATGTLSAHVGQRIRWARGMIQIFRIDNPLLNTGMKFTQRLCYFNAMMHFLYAVPRLIFLCAPLAYMVFGLTIIPGYWVAILAYAMPHLVLSSITNSRVQAKHRHSFWNEIYETVLAPYILLPTLLALINPKLGSFNVTDKDSTLTETRFDRHIAAPTTWLLALNFLGICMTPYRLHFTDPGHYGTVLSNLVWIFFNMVILGVAGAVANEQMQRRSSVRIPAKLDVKVSFPDGRHLDGVTRDISVGGTAIDFSHAVDVPTGATVQVAFPDQTGDAKVSATVAARMGDELRLQFVAPAIADQETLTRAIYSRADSWMYSREHIEADRPLVSLARVVRLSFTGFHQVLRGLLPARKARAASILLFSVLALSHRVGSAQIPGAVAPQSTIQVPPFTPLTAAPLDPLAPQLTAASANDIITLKEMGSQRGIEMRGPHSFYSQRFVLPLNRVPRRAAIEISYHFNPLILAQTGSIKVLINGLPVGTIEPPLHAQSPSEFGFTALSVPAEQLTRNNDITFEFTGSTALQPDGSVHSAVLAVIGASSRVLVAGDAVPLKTDLGLLPLPFFDPDLQTTTTIPFVFLAPPNPETLRAAGIVASWFGIQASTRPVHFTVSIGQIPQGNVIVFTNQGASQASTLGIPAGGPSLSIRPNPSDAQGNALILAGDDDTQLLLAARSLALMTISHPGPGDPGPSLGESARLSDFALPAPRKPDDAPRWLTTDKLTSLWSYSSEQAMQSNGSAPIPVYFRVPPDLYYGETQNLNLRLNYRYNATPLAQGSALRAFVNGGLINEAPLPPGNDFTDRHRTVVTPVAVLRPFGNTLLFNFDFVPLHPNDPGQAASQKLQGAILENSSLDIRGLHHWARMPNLELFANAGFPFTRKADLADTTIVMPPQPNSSEIALLLYMMSHCGMQTGYPALRVQVVGPDAVMRSDQDYLILGGAADQPAFASLDPTLPVTMDADGVHLKDQTSYLATLNKTWLKWTRRTVDEPTNINGAPDLMIEGLESPYFAGRSIVLMELRNDNAVNEFADVFLERSQSSDISHSVSLLRNGKFTSYDVAHATYHVGYISTYALMRLWMAEHFWMLLILVTLFGLITASWIHDYLVWLAENRLRVDPAA
ncbi:MAG: UDP-forming cellulose synthase catalytic subunit [Acidobacteriaceae bacterium]|nr:UDP-forming cellulose synthase catalytic subunit [Acidobacteriaceae bacterium]